MSKIIQNLQTNFLKLQIISIIINNFLYSNLFIITITRFINFITYLIIFINYLMLSKFSIHKELKTYNI